MHLNTVLLCKIPTCLTFSTIWYVLYGIPACCVAAGVQQKLAVAAEQIRATSSRPAVLGRPPSEKKWAYPMPTGSPMFERVRSRNHDPDQSQDQQAAPASNADTLQPGPPPVQAVAAGVLGQEHDTGPADRSASASSVHALHCCEHIKATIEQVGLLELS